MNMRHLLYFLAVFIIFNPLAARAADQVMVAARVDESSAQPGQTVHVLITAYVAKGFHAQSHTPKDPSYLPFEIAAVASSADAKVGQPQYPAGTDETYPALGTLNVYTGMVSTIVPVTIAPNAKAGSIAISGKVRSQACDDNACYPPKTAKFAVTINVTGAGATTTPTTAAATQASETSSPASAIPPPSDGGSSFEQNLGDHSYLLAFSAALLVGVIFNAMPCVLPVVPLKIMGFYEAAKHDRRRCIALGLAFSVGLVASFGVLAILVVGMRVLTWGGLFQQPLFIGAIVIVLTVMAIGQFGFFSIQLPTAVYGFTPRHDTYTGNFLFGVLTAALSTPCTIGMFAVLLAWALRQPAFIGVALVMTVGVGMAAPYLILSGFPQLARRFPRTGPLGELVKQGMAFLLLATAWYFAWPFAERIVTARQFWWILFGVIAACGAFLIIRSMMLFATRRALAFAMLAAALLIAPALWGTLKLTRQPYRWDEFTTDAVARASAQGRPVLVEFTADWCGNCHALEAFVLNDDRVIDAVRRGGVVMLKADVTRSDSAAMPLLSQLNPAGSIPLTAVYLPGKTEPEVLNGLYGVDNLLRAIVSPDRSLSKAPA